MCIYHHISKVNVCILNPNDEREHKVKNMCLCVRVTKCIMIQWVVYTYLIQRAEY
jgi:hypothetical protein